MDMMANTHPPPLPNTERVNVQHAIIQISKLFETTSHLTLLTPFYSASGFAKTGEDFCTVFFRSVGLDSYKYISALG